MESSIALILLLVIGVPICLGIWLVIRALDARARIDELTQRLTRLEGILGPRPNDIEKAPWVAPVPPPTPVLAEAPPPPIIKQPAPSIPPAPPRKEFAPPVDPRPRPEPVFALAKPSINWEQFMGVKLFAWLGGLALFLGVAFFVKYSFDNNLIRPEVRMAIGFLGGLGLLIGGVKMSNKNYLVLSQTLCATGVVILYAVTFACRSIYHFPFFGALPTFFVMALVTTAAFLLAVQLSAQVVAILGMLGGFLTPVLLSTHQDNPFGLFGYIAILDIGLILVSLRRRWFYLAALGALGTVAMQIGWAWNFFEDGKYYICNKIFIPLGVFLGFQILYLLANAWTQRKQQCNWWVAGSALGLAGIALAFSGWFVGFAPLADRPFLIFTFMFLVDAGIAALALLDNKTAPAQAIAGLAVFGILGFWTTDHLKNELLNAALLFYFVFAVAHTVFPLWLQRRFGVRTSLWAGHIFPALALLLVLAPIFKLAEVSFIVWPFILLIDLLAIVMAALLESIISVLAALVLTLAAVGALIFRIPTELTGVTIPFSLLAGFAIFFVAVSLWLLKKVKLPDSNPQLTQQLPVCAAVLPFLLLIMATLRLPLANPSPIFGVGLLLVILLLGLAELLSVDLLPAVGLICVTAVECSWHLNRFEANHASLVLLWYLAFFIVFTVYPFLFMREFSSRTIPWATSAAAGLPQFFLIHRLIAAAWPNQIMGLLPFAFAIPSLIALAVVLRKIPAENPVRLNVLAWFGGIALFFVTLIFPIQFDRQWITIGWALEGAALLWLFHRVPHPGLRLAAAWLLAIAFARLALNPAVLGYHPRSATAIWNWYLYSYGIVTVCLFVGAKLLAPPRNSVMGLNAPPILSGLGTVLAFLLLNIEIADYFSAPGATLTFDFSGNFARDMTYSIAWAIFALTLLAVGLVKKSASTRYAALGLFSITLLKLFFHDLAQLAQLYRIAALISVAVMAMLASFAYQRFFARTAEQKEKSETASQV